MLLLNYKGVLEAISQEQINKMEEETNEALLKLLTKTGVGSEYTGWVEYPYSVTENDLGRVIKASKEIRKQSKILVVIGVGGSYLGAKAALTMLEGNQFKEQENEVIFVGNTFSSNYTYNVIDYIKDKDFSVNVISKSGTTTEPAVAFRIFRNLLKEKYGKDYNKRIFVTTTINKGALYNLAVDEGYEIFSIPEDIGGRYSVLTTVGLLPIAYKGIDIRAIIAGAKASFDVYTKTPYLDNDAMLYAAIRNLAYRNGKTVEILGLFEPGLHYLGEWYKQLFGESEGKDGKGLYPTFNTYTTDLHALGQYVQDGERLFLETFIHVDRPTNDLMVPKEESDFDGINYLTNLTLNEINKRAKMGTIKAHKSGGVPVVDIRMPEMTPYYFGYLTFFLMLSCGISGYLLGVNPFDQEGVEAYKNNMFGMLGRPGYEKYKQD
ncbi:MAG: glucose-6-phosphate isomerase [Bacilli bacterium]